MCQSCHKPAASFTSGTPQTIEVHVTSPVGEMRLKYRHVNQAEYYETAETTAQRGGVYHAVIPAAYASTKFAPQYYFELQHNAHQSSIFPGLGADLTGRQYFLVEQA
ncbi:hypothetical protein [Granulicella arctica]|uniref:hypothetical protein n=1 Tax=Granulicella arctica TaxID=940613 RepID=UPI0021E08A52|nr:hypothetical protein [Granulicella arctica]